MMSTDRPRQSFLRRALPWLIVLALLIGMFVQRARISRQSSGSSDPVLTVEFPETATPGSVETAVLEIQNPSSDDIEMLFVAFSLVGVAGGSGFPDPIVVAGARDASIQEVEPRPDVRVDGVRFGFGRLEAGASQTIEFDLRLPEVSGKVGNAVQVYDGTAPDRATGTSLVTTVGG